MVSLFSAYMSMYIYIHIMYVSLSTYINYVSTSQHTSTTRVAGYDCVMYAGCHDMVLQDSMCRKSQRTAYGFKPFQQLQAQHPVAGEFLNGGFYGGRAAALEIALRQLGGHKRTLTMSEVLSCVVLDSGLSMAHKSC